MADHHTPPHAQGHSTLFSTPVALMLDTRLTPLERNGWQVLRMLRADNGLSPLANLGQLRRYLTSTPLGQRAGYETAWRALIVLRLTGWISLVGQHRDPMTGHVLSELYQVHEEALDFHRACALDASLAPLLQSSVGHENNQVDRIALHIQQTRGNVTLATPVDTAHQPHEDDDEPPSPPPPASVDPYGAESPASGEDASRPAGLQQTAGGCQTTHAQYRTYKTYLYKERTYRARAHEAAPMSAPAMTLPPCLSSAEAEQQKDVLSALRRLPPEQRQDVLDELQARSQSGTVRNVIAYFFGLVKRVLAGEFRLWAGRKALQPASPPPQGSQATAQRVETRPESPVPPASRETALAHIAHIREILKMPKHAAGLTEQAMQARGWRPHPA